MGVPVQTGVVAPPITWARGGRQYVTLVAGWGGAYPLLVGGLALDGRGRKIPNKSRVLTFALDGTMQLPPQSIAAIAPLNPPAQFADAATVAMGQQGYDRSCVACHGSGAVSGGIAPDLRHSGTIADAGAWKSVLIDGVLTDRGMVSFKENFTPRQIEAIRAYVIARALVGARLEKIQHR